jgi:octaprenyl-diphosphate synthase
MVRSRGCYHPAADALTPQSIEGDKVTQLSGFGRAERPRPDPASLFLEVLPLVGDSLERVEAMFREMLASPVAIVHEVGDYVAAGDGKRLRPTLHLLCARLCSYRGPHDVVLATVLEMIHCATLIHDDVIDEADTRRGRPSANSRWGNEVTVLFGDYMFAKAMQIALRAESLEVMELLAEATLRMTEGEMLQTRYVGRLDLTVDDCVTLIEKKTAALFGCCCELAAVIAGEDDRRRKALRAYGHHLGVTFQLVDDLLDFTGDERTMGKAVASDLGSGKATFAVIDALAAGADEVRELAHRVMVGARDLSVERLRRRLEESGAIRRTRELAAFHAREAARPLEAFPPSPARDALRALPSLLLERDR